MGLVSDLRRRIEVPDEPGHHVVVRMLSWLTLDKAKTVRVHAMAEMRDVFAALSDLKGATSERPSAPAEPADRLKNYDRLTLLRHGIVEWSYDAALPDGVEELDERTAEWAARAILDFTLPDEQQTKPPSSLSTGT